MKYILALDQGTTSSRAILFDHHGEICAMAQEEFPQFYPQPGWVEHDARDIWRGQLKVARQAMEKLGIKASDVAAIGVTNQRETTVVWDKESGQPICHAIVWQCRRTAPMIDEIVKQGWTAKIKARTGLIPDAYFSGSKIAWILDNVEGAREKAEEGKLLFGTIDTWLIWNLTGGKAHVTDVTNASRTMLFDIHKKEWDQELLDLFRIPRSMLPEVKPSSCVYGTTESYWFGGEIPVAGAAGDQQAALFGQCCFEAGQAKNTYGTGCFMLLNTGHEAIESKNSLVTTIAASAPGTEGLEYALEGSVFVGGAVVQWLRDEVGLIRSAAETEYLATSVKDTGGVYIVPAFTGLGAPWWSPDARGAIFGITRGTGQAQLVRAALESIAYQVSDLAVAMEADAGKPIDVLNVDGGAAANNFLMQFQSNILDRTLHRPQNRETTAMGAAYLAGLATGFWSGTDELRGLRASDDVFTPKMDAEMREELLAGWHEAIRRTV